MTKKSFRYIKNADDERLLEIYELKVAEIHTWQDRLSEAFRTRYTDPQRLANAVSNLTGRRNGLAAAMAEMDARGLEW